MLQLKSIKYAAFSSHETNCYEAKLYFKGKHVANVSNGGHGGCDDIYFVSMQEEVLAWADKNLRVADDPDFQDLYDKSTPWTLIEMKCGHLMNDHLVAKDLKKIMSKRVIYTVKDKAGIYQTKSARNAAQRDQWIPQVQGWDTTENVLNALPFDQALAIFEERI